MTIDTMFPHLAQGVLTLEIRSDDLELENIIYYIKDEDSEIQVLAERGVLAGVDGDEARKNNRKYFRYKR